MSAPTTTTHRDRVDVRVDDGSFTITLAREQAGNGLDLDMAFALVEAVTEAGRVAADRTVRSVVLRARGPVFCVGGDLRYFAAAPDRAGRMQQVATAMAEAISGLSRLPVPVVSVVSGTAAGGGIGLALAADIVIVGPRAKFKTAYTAAGLSPDCGVTLELIRRTGLARALDLVLTDRLVDAVEAERLGLATTVAPDPDEAAAQLVTQFNQGSYDALARSKSLLRGFPGMNDQQVRALAAEVRAIVELVAGADGVEGVDAFLGKRRPEFR